jgi:2-polyprenyl-3-methyl-5-hydroxy-6-metoxy-1,4-benzoquinol methylase
VLELGGGEGFFANELLRARPDVRLSVVEPQAEMSRFPTNNVTVHKMFIEEWLTLRDVRRFDAIVAMDLIEHLRDPSEVIKTICRDFLKEDGRVVITTPNAHSYQRALLGKYWPHYKVEHLTYPSPKALENLAHSAGLQVQEMSSLAKPLRLGYLIAVLRNFGPIATRYVGRIAHAVVPSFLLSTHVKLPSGELLFVGRKICEV